MPSHTEDSNFMHERRSLEEPRQSKPSLYQQPFLIMGHKTRDGNLPLESGNLPEIANQKENNQHFYYLAETSANHRAGGTKHTNVSSLWLGPCAAPIRANPVGITSHLSLCPFYRCKTQERSHILVQSLD